MKRIITMRTKASTRNIRKQKNWEIVIPYTGSTETRETDKKEKSINNYSSDMNPLS